MSLNLRTRFPLLAQSSVVYLDTAASAQKPDCVLECMQHAYEATYANVHRGLYDLANQATECFEKARVTVQHFLHAASPEEIVFTRNATEAINLVAASYLAPLIKPGDEIIVSIMEHHANIVPWHFLRERYGAKLVWAPIDDAGQLDMATLETLFSSRTRFLAITHMSNVLGTSVNIKDVVDLAHAHQVPVLVDGAQATVHAPVDVVQLGCDFYVFTGHKIYGPSGVGILYGKKKLLEAMPPYQGGGEMIAEVTCDAITYARLPYKFEAGTPAIVDVIGLGAAIDFINSVGFEAIMTHERQLSQKLKGILSKQKDVCLIGDPSLKRGIFAFTVKDIHPHDVAMVLNQYGIAIRAGHHCAQPLVERFGVYATCRASLGIYSQENDIDRFAEGLEKTISFFKKG